jgi:hypothetical protein
MADNVKVSRFKVESYCRSVNKELEIIINSVTGPANHPSFNITCIVDELSSTFSGPTKKLCVELCCAELLKVLPKIDVKDYPVNILTEHIRLLFESLNVFEAVDKLYVIKKAVYCHIHLNLEDGAVLSNCREIKNYLKTISYCAKSDPIGFRRTIKALTTIFLERDYTFKLNRDSEANNEVYYYYTISKQYWCEECSTGEMCDEPVQDSFKNLGV